MMIIEINRNEGGNILQHITFVIFKGEHKFFKGGTEINPEIQVGF